jgi:hypothetical protein
MPSPPGKHDEFGVEPANSELGEVSRRLHDAVKAAGGASLVSQKSGVPKSTLHTYVNGQDMKLSNAIALAAACGVTIEWLITGRNPGDPVPAAAQRLAPQALMATINTDRLATAIALIDRKIPTKASVRDRAVAIVALYDIILPMDEDQVASLLEQQR